MSDSPSFGTIDVPSAPEKPTSATPFRIAYLADLSGRAHRGETGGADEIAERAGVVVRREEFDEALSGLEPKLSIPVPGTKKTADLEFSSLDDFGPDGIWDRTDPLFRKLASDDERAAKMSGILHHADFRTVERAWRGVDWLLRRVAKDEKVEVVVFDVTEAELAADLGATEDLAATGVHRMLAKAATGKKAKPWGLVFADAVFEPDAAGAALLGRLAKIAASLCAPACVGVTGTPLDPSWKQDEDASAAWTALRALPEAAYLAVGVSRFVLRTPWGGSNSIERFEYEEMSSPPKADEYLWGNAGLACAALVAGAFVERGWSLKPAAAQLGKMPLHVYEEEGEKTSTVTEAWFEAKHVRSLEALGLSPFIAVKNADAIQATALQCIAGKPLSGRWGHAAGVAKAESTKPAIGGPKMNLGAGRLPPSAGGDDEEPAPRRRAAPAPEPEAPADEPPAEAAAPSEDAAPAAEASDAPAAEAPSGGDTDLDALLKSLDTPSEPAADAPAAEASSAGDTDLDALLKSLETPSGGEAASDAPADAPSGGDTDLDALLKSLETPAEGEPSADAAAGDADLDALLKSLESPPEEEK